MYDFVIVVIFVSFDSFGFEGGALVLIALVPGHCLSFTFFMSLKLNVWLE